MTNVPPDSYLDFMDGAVEYALDMAQFSSNEWSSVPRPDWMSSELVANIQRILTKVKEAERHVRR